MSNQLFEAVPVSEKPEKDDWYPCLLNNEARSSAHILFARGKWNTHYNITHWLRPIAPAKEAEQSREQIVTNEEMNRVFEGTNFGAMKPREVIAEAVRKIAQGWSNGKTSQQCIKELGLIEYRNNQWGLSDKGLKYLLAGSVAYTGQAGAIYPKGAEDINEAFRLHLFDIVWNHAKEDISVPETGWAKRMIKEAVETFEHPERKALSAKRSNPDYGITAQSSEASTGQEGEVKLLRDALARLMQAIPNQSNDYDWWPDELSTAFELANEALSSPSHTPEDGLKAAEKTEGETDYKYFVSYTWNSKSQSGNGCLQMSLTNPVTSYDDIKVMLEWLNGRVKDQYGNSCGCVINNYIPFPPVQSPTPTTDKVEEEIKRHSYTWDAACTWFENSGGPANDLIPNKDQYLQSLKEKLRNK